MEIFHIITIPLLPNPRNYSNPAVSEMLLPSFSGLNSFDEIHFLHHAPAILPSICSTLEACGLPLKYLFAHRVSPLYYVYLDILNGNYTMTFIGCQLLIVKEYASLFIFCQACSLFINLFT